MSKLNDSENNSIENDFHILIDNKNKNLEDNINDDNTILNSQKKENSIQNQNKEKEIDLSQVKKKKDEVIELSDDTETTNIETKNNEDECLVYIQKAYSYSSDYMIFIEIKKLETKKNFFVELNEYETNYNIVCEFELYTKDNHWYLNLDIECKLISKKKYIENNNLELESNLCKYSFDKKYFKSIARTNVTLDLSNNKKINIEQFDLGNIIKKIDKDLNESKSIFRLRISKKNNNGIYWNPKNPLKKIGIINEGNTCYMNSIVQSLYNLPFLRNEILQIQLNENNNISKEEILKNNIILSLQKIFYELHYKKKNIKISYLFKSLEWEREYWNSPQDAAEIYLKIYDIISEKNNFIKENCEGRLIAKIECPNVNYSTSKEEKFFFLQLDVTHNNIEDCIQKFFEKEELTDDNKFKYENPKTKKISYEKAFKSYTLEKIPNILFIQFKRFQIDLNVMKYIKKNNLVKYQKDLNLSKYLPNSTKKNYETNYTLYCIIIQSGCLDMGHYYLFINDFTKKKWIKLNDSYVEEVDDKQVFNENYGGFRDDISVQNGNIEVKNVDIDTSAYILIYIRNDYIKKFFEENEKYFDKIKTVIDKMNNIEEEDKKLKKYSKKNINKFDNEKKEDFVIEINNTDSETISNEEKNEKIFNKNYKNITKKRLIETNYKYTQKEKNIKLNALTNRTNFKTIHNITNLKGYEGTGTTNYKNIDIIKNINLNKYANVNFNKNQIKIPMILMSESLDKINSSKKREPLELNLNNMKTIQLNNIGLLIKIFDDNENINNLVSNNTNLNLIIDEFEYQDNLIFVEYKYIITINFVSNDFFPDYNNNGIIFKYPYISYEYQSFKNYSELKDKIVNLSQLVLNNNEKIGELYKINIDNFKIYYISNSENTIISVNWNGLKIELLNPKSNFFLLNKRIENRKIFRFIIELNKI